MMGDFIFRLFQMNIKSLQTICADAILDSLGEKPDLIQQLVGERAIERMGKVIRKNERRRAELRVKKKAATEIGVLVSAMIQDILTNGLSPVTLLRDDASSIAGRFPDADPDLVERAWVIARQAIEEVENGFR
jgi:hypothetical protein